ncbi:MAG TPA: HipA N-terminal domain-containing protein, partial [Gammaproteobacteria bacterium]|nr:HipA N-terminal domain-containing protein [Gammaproteobacteria bacterium]
MQKSEALNVWYEDLLVGELWREETGRMGFQYEDNWLMNGFPISQQLPLTNKQYPPDNAKAHKFFANLLPEEGARLHIVRNLKITNTDFELLKAIGGECAGALSILPKEYSQKKLHGYKLLSHEELQMIISRKTNLIGSVSQENRPRLSLAGAQDKCPIFYDKDNYYLPQGAAPSTHILKFELLDYRNIPVYEYFLSKLAKTVGLPVVECELKKGDREYYLLIKRYDRI